MASKIVSVLKDNKLITVIMAASLLTLLVGVALIITAPEPINSVPESSPPQNELLATEPEFSEDVITSAERASGLIHELSQSTDQSQTPVASQAPAVNITRGSEEWCEAMMSKADADWNEADTQLFAQKCLEPEVGL